MAGKAKERLFGGALNNNQAAFLILSLTVLQVISMGILFETPQQNVSPTGLTSGEVEGNVQNEPPTNLNHTVSNAYEEYGGYPAVRLEYGESVLVEGNETDANGEGDLTSSDCVWDATGFTSTTSISFNSCNATYCNYTCSLAISESTPFDTLYDITTRIIDDGGLTSQLTSSFYLFSPSATPTPTPSGGQALGGSGGSHDVFILIPIPPSGLPELPPVSPPTPTPTRQPGVTPPPQPGFNFEIKTPDKISRCEVSEAVVEVENSASEEKVFTVEVGSMRREVSLNAGETGKIVFKIRAPQVDEKRDLLFQARLYIDGSPVAVGQAKIELDWEGMHICAEFKPGKVFDPAAGRGSIGEIEFTVVNSQERYSLEVEVLKETKNVFLDLIEPNPPYYSKTVRVFDTGEYLVKGRLRKGFETIEEKVEKVWAVD
jgi:hypothetical protein